MVAVLLAAGGLAKWRTPLPTVESFRGLGLPAAPWSVRALATVEVALGGALIALGGRALAALGAAIFAAFTIASAMLLRRADTVGSCGCFGAASAPPSRVHVVVDATSTVVLIVAAVVGLPGTFVSWGSGPGNGAVELGLVLLGGALLVAISTVLADTLAAVALATGPPDAVGAPVLFRSRVPDRPSGSAT
jgi:hypothetical protein